MLLESGCAQDRDRPGPFTFRLFVTIGWLVVVAAAFAAGYLLADYDADLLVARLQELQAERDRLKETLTAERAALVRLERSHQIDREAKRVAQADLMDLQAERLRFEKQATFFEWLMRGDDTGVVEVKEFLLTKSAVANTFDYQLLVNQLIPEFGRSVGNAVVRLAVRRGKDSELLALSDLPGSTSGRHAFAFDHFQFLQGTIRVPADLEPLYVTVDIEPESDNLLGTTESFAWHAGDASGLLPILEVPGAAGDTSSAR